MHRYHPHHFHRTYLDSFDWRLFNAGYYLIADKNELGFKLQLFALATQQLVTQVQQQELPRFHQDLGTSKLADVLAPILDLRALLQQLALDIQQQRIQILNKADKLQAEILIEDCKLLHRDQQIHFKQLRHTGLKGYAKANRKITDHLANEPMLKVQKKATLIRLIDQLGIDTQYSTKPNIKLAAHAASGEQTIRLLSHFFTTMQNNHAGVIEDLDTEFLHDYRIAVRRSRTLLSQMPDIVRPLEVELVVVLVGLHAHRVADLAEQFAELGDVTTPLRDLDVMQINFDDYRILLPNEMRVPLEPAYEFVCRQRQQAYKNLCQHLRSTNHADFCQRWATFLAQKTRSGRLGEVAQRPTLDVANQHIWKIYKRSLKQGRAITPASAAEDLHRLRKTCKKLRYLMEFYQSLYPTKSIKRLIKVLKQLQDNLGEFQDLHVHMDFFRELESTMRQQGCLEANTQQALTVLQQALDRQQLAIRNDFFTRFEDFSNAQHQTWFRKLFKQ